MKTLLPKLILKLSVLISLVLLCLSVVSPALALDATFTLTPPSVNIEGKPGDIVQKTIKITNGSEEQDLNLRAFVADFIVQDDAGTPIKVTGSASGRYLASPWFTIEKSEFSIKPKETISIVVIIHIPKDALPGGHYAGVFFEPVPAKDTKESKSYTAIQVGSLFEITVAGDIKYDAIIKDFKTTTNVSEFGPIDFEAVVENQSDTHISPVSQIVIKDMFGRKLTEIDLNKINIFPFASRTLKGTWDTVWGLGRYTATLTVTYGPELTVSRSLYFWIMPYTLIISALVVLLVLLALFILVRRHLKHVDDHRDEEIDNLKRKIAEMENKTN